MLRTTRPHDLQTGLGPVFRVDVGDYLWANYGQKPGRRHRLLKDSDELIGRGTIDLIRELAEQHANARVRNDLKLCDGVFCLLLRITTRPQVMTDLLTQIRLVDEHGHFLLLPHARAIARAGGLVDLVVLGRLIAEVFPRPHSILAHFQVATCAGWIDVVVHMDLRAVRSVETNAANCRTSADRVEVECARTVGNQCVAWHVVDLEMQDLNAQARRRNGASAEDKRCFSAFAVGELPEEAEGHWAILYDALDDRIGYIW